MSANPFTFGNPIRDPSRFYGRDNEVRQIASRLLSSGHESTSVVGERRLGKTSLLYYLKDPQVAEQLGFTPDRYCLIYIDFQGLVDITPQRFWERVLEKMSRTICHQSLQAEIKTLLEIPDFDLFDLEDLFEKTSAADLTTVLLLDEFEYVTQNPNFKTDFFGGLRALAMHHNLPLVTSTGRELVDLCHSQEIKGSPFFNIFASVVLRPFTRQQALDLVDGYINQAGLEVSAEEKELVITLGGGNPFFVQMAGYYLVEARRTGFTGEIHDLAHPELVKRVTSDFESQADPHFTYLWSHCSESEKITVLSVISLHRQKPSRKTLPTMENLSRLNPYAQIDVPELVKRGLLLESDSGKHYRLFSPSLERWIIREITATPQEAETPEKVEEWVQESGQDLVDPVRGTLPKFKRKYWPIVSTVLREISFELAGAATFELLVKALT